MKNAYLTILTPALNKIVGFHLCQRTRCFKCTFLKIYVKWDNFKLLLAFFFSVNHVFWSVFLLVCSQIFF